MGLTYLWMLGFVVDGDGNKDQDQKQNQHEQHGAELQQHVAATERRRGAPRGNHRRSWRGFLLAITHQHLEHHRHNSNTLGDDQPVCESCRLPFTVKHTLVDCPNLQDT